MPMTFTEYMLTQELIKEVELFEQYEPEMPKKTLKGQLPFIIKALAEKHFRHADEIQSTPYGVQVIDDQRVIAFQISQESIWAGGERGDVPTIDIGFDWLPGQGPEERSGKEGMTAVAKEMRPASVRIAKQMYEFLKDLSQFAVGIIFMPEISTNASPEQRYRRRDWYHTVLQRAGYLEVPNKGFFPAPLAKQMQQLQQVR